MERGVPLFWIPVCPANAFGSLLGLTIVLARGSGMDTLSGVILS